jgi:hypothetical protein
LLEKKLGWEVGPPAYMMTVAQRDCAYCAFPSLFLQYAKLQTLPEEEKKKEKLSRFQAKGK